MSNKPISYKLVYNRKNELDENGKAVIQIRAYIEIAGFNFGYKNDIDINKIWAQAYQLATSGFESEITREEMLANEERNQRFTIMSQEAELIQEYFRKPKPEEMNNAEYLTATLIADRLATVSHLRPAGHRVGKAMQQLEFQSIRIPKTDRYGYAVIQTKERANPRPSVFTTESIEQLF